MFKDINDNLHFTLPKIDNVQENRGKRTMQNGVLQLIFILMLKKKRWKHFLKEVMKQKI